MVDIKEVNSKQDWRAFKDLPWIVNRHDRQWVPPLKMGLDDLFDLKGHPFWNTVFHQFFLATRNNKVIGRIGVFMHKEDRPLIGYWGFLEAEEDSEVFALLLKKAEDFLKAQGCRKIIGPLNPSINYELGVLVEGFETPPYVMLSHNPDYYDRLIKATGHQKEKDFYSYIIDAGSFKVTDKVKRVIDSAMKRNRITIRPVNPKNFESELKILFDIYNDAFEKHWGFLPMSMEEFRYMAKDLNQIIDPDLIFLLYGDGQPVGFILSLPNINEILSHIPSGKLFPFGLFKFLYYKKKVRTIRVITIAIKQKYQHLGLGSFLYKAVGETAVQKGYRQAELSWVIENNIPMNKAASDLGGRVYKKYRLYSKEMDT